MLNGIKICRSATVSYYLVAQLKRQAEYFRDQGMEVVLVSSEGPELNQLVLNDSLRHEVVRIERSISFIDDLAALIRLVRLFRRHRFDIVHSTTPKAGLLTALAGFFCCVPIRLHTFTGQQWVTMKGPIRWLSKMADRLIGRLCTHCYADSESQRRFLVEQNILSDSSISVIGEGSLAGVDRNRFDPSRWNEAQGDALRGRLSIPGDAFVFCYIGRITRDKGISELLSSFAVLHSMGFNADLLLLGPLDSDCGGSRSSSNFSGLLKSPRVHCLGYVNDPEQFLAISDILCLPSYREGFGTVVIEAAAMGVPAVGTRITGLVDAIVDGETGILVVPRDEGSLLAAMQKCLESPGLVKKMGKAAQQRCARSFDSSIVNRKVAEEYERLLRQAGRSRA
ncbi:MAG: glycosyltransferase family 4 protein [Thermodesulfobacteriota bacterium]